MLNFRRPHVNSQNAAISLKPIHSFDKIKLILYWQQGRQGQFLAGKAATVVAKSAAALDKL